MLMKRFKYILSAIAVMLSLTACEMEILLTNVLDIDRITISAIVTPDTVVIAYITRANEIDYFSSIALRSYYYNYDKITTSRNHLSLDSIDLASIIKDANAELIVNERYVYQMVYDSIYHTYKSEYTPMQGDVVSIHVEAESSPDNAGNRIKYDPAEATAKLPSLTPKIEVLNKEVKFKAKEYIQVIDYGSDTTYISDYWGADTVMTMKVKIKDPGNEKNFYRLLVRSVGASRLYSGSYSATFMTHICVDEFKSDDILFYDSALSKPYGFLPAYFSNVFDDELINGKEYEFTIESRMRRQSEITPYVILELQHLSPDLYYYLKDIEVFRISNFDLYDNPFQINSNVNGGWGVFGAMNYNTLIIPF